MKLTPDKSDRITIFWIEDNPIQESTVEVGDLAFPSFEIGGDKSNLFSFKIFQHPVEIYEYLSMIGELSEKGLLSSLPPNCGEVVPDIVVFDYKLSDNFTTKGDFALSYRKQHQFLSDHSASLELKKSFQAEFNKRELFLERNDVRTGNYRSSEFRDDIKVPNINGLDDEFGLFAGIAIVREFKDSITLGVPATLNKNKPDLMSENSLFYEWLNTYDMKDAIQRPDKGSKNWDEILEFALPLLRNRIVKQVATGKIVIDYDQLIRLSNANHEEKCLSFYSVYGEKNLLLRGLFIAPHSVVEREKKPVENSVDEMIGNGTDEAVDGAESEPIITPAVGETTQDFACRITDALCYRNIDISSIALAIEASDRLWEIYTEEFGRRFRLSELHRIERVTAKPLDPDEQEKYNGLRREFFPDDGAPKEASVIAYLAAGEKGQNFVVRLAVLHLAARAEIALNQSKEYNERREIYQNLNLHEFLYIFFPRVRFKDNSIELPIHLDAPKRSRCEDNLVKSLNERIFGERLSNSGWFGFTWAESSELRLLRSKFYAEIPFWPGWLQ